MATTKKLILEFQNVLNIPEQKNIDNMDIHDAKSQELIFFAFLYFEKTVEGYFSNRGASKYLCELLTIKFSEKHTGNKSLTVMIDLSL